MKHFLGTIAACLLTLAVAAQYTIKGKITNQKTIRPVEDATVTLSTGGQTIATQVTGRDGTYQFSSLKRKGKYQLLTTHVSMAKAATEIEVNESVTINDVLMEQQSYYLEPLEVRSTRASDRSPFAKTNISKADIAKNNLGQDLPFLLNQTPGVVINSDAGNGVGYTGIRIRGTDATRINVTINGVPYNDPESQGTFLVDLPDIASSVNSIQIQRGVGTSSNGAGAFGASLNLSTNEFNDKAYGEFNNTFGSFNTWKNTVRVGSGLINDHFTIDARLSKISSDGYIDRASTDLESFYLSTAYFNKQSSLRLNIFSGTEKTYQAWNGVPESLLQANRTYNSSGTQKPGEPYENETDNYQQDHYQLIFNHAFSPNLSFNTTLFLINGKGYYEQYKARARFSAYGLANPVINGTAVTRTDLVRQLWLDNSFYGQVYSLQYKKNLNQFTVGGGWNNYDGDHFGKVIWAQTSIPKDHQFYNNTADKKDVNVYAKWEHTLSNRWNVYTDIQFRNVNYNINGFRDNPTVVVNRNFNFINPKAGISYNNAGYQAYLSYAMATKEPNRNDFEAGVTNQPKPEQLHDFELGFQKTNVIFSYGANAYYMLYKDQLILTGQVNDVGAYTRTNVPESYRLGVELQGNVRVAKWINAGANLTLSRNKIEWSSEYIDDYDNGGQILKQHTSTNISFSPSVIGGATINFIPAKNAEISLISKYVSRQYLDNTEDKSRSLNPYYTQDLRLSYTIKKRLFNEWNIIALVNNVFNKMYEPNGYTFSYISAGQATTENFYFPMAGTNYMLGVNIKL
ncbi:MAG: TonB-dependent receptor [Segetibacter sp.]|nr:TonB-dependent receptor [Segetibacter sp.]